jgi:hypothetical protein
MYVCFLSLSLSLSLSRVSTHPSPPRPAPNPLLFILNTRHGYQVKLLDHHRKDDTWRLVPVIIFMRIASVVIVAFRLACT